MLLGPDGKDISKWMNGIIKDVNGKAISELSPAFEPAFESFHGLDIYEYTGPLRSGYWEAGDFSTPHQSLLHRFAETSEPGYHYLSKACTYTISTVECQRGGFESREMGFRVDFQLIHPMRYTRILFTMAVPYLVKLIIHKRSGISSGFSRTMINGEIGGRVCFDVYLGELYWSVKFSVPKQANLEFDEMTRRNQYYAEFLKVVDPRGYAQRADLP